MQEEKIRQVNEMIKRDLGEIILKEMELPSGDFCDIERVSTSSDLSFCKVFISVFPQKEEKRILEIFNKSAGFFRAMMEKKTKIRKIPRFIFKIENNEAQKKIEKLEQILDNLNN
jgi:ribosome-binding factor A